MSLKQSAISYGMRALRLVGVFALIYVSMVFYLALTERQNAYPRAIAHKEAEAAIQSKARSVSCTLEDGVVLGGWTLAPDGTESDENATLLYYPDADEDAAQFLAEVQGIPNVILVTFNYRGSANNKGTPSSENFLPDAGQIAECASQVQGKRPEFLAGRGTGAILAAHQMVENQNLLLIDPVMSIADVLSEKYRALYPKFMIRASEAMPVDAIKKNKKHVFILSDRKLHESSTDKFSKTLNLTNKAIRGQQTLASALTILLQQTK